MKVIEVAGLNFYNERSSGAWSPQGKGQSHTDRTCSATTSSTCITSFDRNGSAYSTPAICP